MAAVQCRHVRSSCGAGVARPRRRQLAPTARSSPAPDKPRPRFLVVSSSSAAAPVGEAKIKVVGVGGAGGNAVAHMLDSGLTGIELWACNTDAQALAQHPCNNRMQIGLESTRGLGCGGSPDIGQAAALESSEGIKKMVAGADLVFVTAGMGGGTGTGAAPVVARLAKEAGILTVGVVTCPFSFEGRRRAGQAIAGIQALRGAVDSVIVIPNDKLLEVSGEATSLTDAFCLADDVLRQGVQGISDIVTTPGLINVDFADVRAVMQNAGTAMLGIGCASGPARAEQAAVAAVSAPLISNSVSAAAGIIFNISGGPDMTLAEVNRVSEVVTSLASPEANIIFGSVVDPRYEGELRVTIVATGFAAHVEEELFATAADRRGRAGAARRAPAAAVPAAGAPAAEAGGDGGLPWQRGQQRFGRRAI